MKIDLENPQSIDIQQATKVLQQGGVIVGPSETCYGLNADATNQLAIKKIFQIKHRPLNQPLLVVVADWSMAKRYVYLKQSELDDIAKKFLPPVTIILPQKRNKLPILLTAGQAFLGVRVSACLVDQQLSRQLDRPLVSTSANLSGQSVCYSIQEVIEQFGQSMEQIDLVLDAGQLSRQKPSTVVKIIKDKIIVLRK